MTQNTEWSPGICARLFETVKPETVVLHSLEIHRYEVLLDAKSVKTVIDPSEVIHAATRLFPAFPRVKFDAELSRTSDHFVLLREVLQILRSQSLENLRNFYFGLSFFFTAPPSLSKLREEFPDSTWAEGIMDDHNVTFTMVDAPGAPQRYKFYVQRVPHGISGKYPHGSKYKSFTRRLPPNMPGFPLLNVPPENFVKIINKVNERTYYRLQKTGRGVNKAIRENDKIYVRFCEAVSFRLKYGKNKKKWMLQLNAPNTEMIVDIEAFYGIRLRVLHMPENNEGFKEFAESLKVNKVTCETLIMYESHWPNEDCSEIVEVLKPVTVAMNSERCDRYTAVFGSTTLKNVTVGLKHADIENAAPQLMSTFSQVDINVLLDGDTIPFDSLRMVLQMLHSQSFPILRLFNFKTGWMSRESPVLPSNEKLEEELRDLNLTVGRIHEKTISAKVGLPLSSGGAVCRLYLKNEISYYCEAVLQFRSPEMAGFSLLDLSQKNFEKVVNKLQSFGYFRLQQTGWEVNQLIRASDNISVHLCRMVHHKLKFDTKTKKWMLRMTSHFPPHRQTLVDIEAFYGTNLGFLETPANYEDFNHFSEVLKGNRMTCGWLLLDKSLWTIEECVTIMEVLKPKTICINSRGCDRFKALLQSTTLENVIMVLNHDYVEPAISQLLPMFSLVNITVSTNTISFDLLRKALQTLYSQPFLKLCEFAFTTFWESQDLPSKEQIEEELRDFNASVEETQEKKISVKLNPSPHYRKCDPVRIAFENTGRFCNAKIKFRGF